jgi:hypothetical protein
VSPTTLTPSKTFRNKAREILKGAKKSKISPLSNEDDHTFMNELFKTHPNAKEKGLFEKDKTIRVFKGRSKQNTPCYFISLENCSDHRLPVHLSENYRIELEDISYMKCINEVAVNLSHNLISSMKDLRLDIRIYLDFVVLIGDKFPLNKSMILKLIIKMIPHSSLNVQMHSIYLRILFYLLQKMPYYEEEILEAVLARFLQIDVGIKSKQLAFKRHFTSQDLKADVYLYYLIQYFRERLNHIEEESIPSLRKPPPMNSAIKKQGDDSDDDSILDSSDNEGTFEDSASAKNKIDRF